MSFGSSFYCWIIPVARGQIRPSGSSSAGKPNGDQRGPTKNPLGAGGVYDDEDNTACISCQLLRDVADLAMCIFSVKWPFATICCAQNIERMSKFALTYFTFCILKKVFSK
jgi:hypothetical protein